MIWGSRPWESLARLLDELLRRHVPERIVRPHAQVPSTRLRKDCPERPIVKYANWVTASVWVVPGRDECMTLWSARVVASLAILGGACMAVSADDATTNDRLADGDFEVDGGWGVSFRDGAEGTWEWDASVARSGGRSLRITKTNGVGHIVLRPTVAPKLSQGERYVLSGHFRSEDAPLTALLLFRLGERDAENFLNPYGLYDCPTHAHIPNCPPGHWEKRVLSFVCTDAPNPDPNFARNYPPGSYPHIILYGNPCTVWLDDVSIDAPREMTHRDRRQYALPYSEAEVLDIVSRREPVSLTVESRRGRSVLVENGKHVPAIFHLTSENNELVGDFESFGEAGVRLAICPVPLPSIWQGEGAFDLAKVDDWAMQTLRKDPNARLLLHFHVYPYDEWGAEHPDECWTNAEGLCGYGRAGRIAGYAKPSEEASDGDPRVFIPSYHSQVWRDESCEAIRAIVRHVKQQPYAAAVGGFYFFGGDDGRLQPGPRDYSTGALAGLRNWCRRTYATPEILSETWGAELADFDAVQIPDDSGAVVFNGVLGRLDPYTLNPQVNDYRAFHIADAWDLCDAWAGAAKGEWERPAIAGIYRDLEEDFLRLRNVDMCGNDSFYPYRRPGYASAGWYPVRTDAHRKLWCMDLDLRSYAGPQIHDEEYEQWIGAALTPEAWSATHDKLTGLCLAKGAGFWYYDMLAYFQDEAIMRGIRETKAVADRLAARRPKRFQPDVAVVIKGHARDWHSVYHNVVTGHIGEWGFNYLQGMMLGTSGVPFDVVYLSDVLG